MFHERDLAYLESEVGPRFDNGTIWWRKTESQRTCEVETCRLTISSPHWRYAGNYFCRLTDALFPSWLHDFAAKNELPTHLSIQAQQLANGGLKLFIPSWEKYPEQYLELNRSELESSLSSLVEAYELRRPRRAEEVRGLLSQIESRS